MHNEQQPIAVKKTVRLNYASSKKKEELNSENNASLKKQKLIMDGQEVEFFAGETIMQVAERYNLAPQIPRYCYHPGMPVAGTCRMCTVEVEKMPKLMTSCSTPAAEGMIVHTKSDKVLKSRRGVMEFLLANHPLDCPVCDKAGECELQDYNFTYGPGTSAFKEEKRVWEEATTKKLSSKITLNMNRCVHCERCVRFTDEVTKSYDLVMENRGWKKELAVADETKGLWNDYQGCLADFCPVGALTFNDFRFQKRVWLLEKKVSLCDGCSKGCNIEVHSDHNIIYRYIPVYNEHVNSHWMCDEGRISYKSYTEPSRIISPLLNGISTTWEFQKPLVQEFVQKQKPVIIVGTDTTNEEGALLLSLAKKLSVEIKSFNGTSDGVTTSSEDKPLDHLLRRKDKTPNTLGLESLGIKPLSLTDNYSAAVVVSFGRSKMEYYKNIISIPQKLLFGIYTEAVNEQLKAQITIPGFATTEKSGSYTNAHGRTQLFQPAVQSTGELISVSQFVSLFS
jgi:NADH-quinone oxidoreductase subunit G